MNNSRSQDTSEGSACKRSYQPVIPHSPRTQTQGETMKKLSKLSKEELRNIIEGKAYLNKTKEELMKEAEGVISWEEGDKKFYAGFPLIVLGFMLSLATFPLVYELREHGFLINTEPDSVVVLVLVLYAGLIFWMVKRGEKEKQEEQ